MTFTDPIGDMFSRIRNGQMRSLNHVEIPSSNFRKNILEILKREGYIKDYFIDKSENNKTVYKLIESIFGNTLYIRNNIKNPNNYVKTLSRFQISRYFPNNNVIPLHDGVYQYYKNIGMINNNPNKKCSLFAGTGNCNLNVINYYNSY